MKDFRGRLPEGFAPPAVGPLLRKRIAEVVGDPSVEKKLTEGRFVVCPEFLDNVRKGKYPA